MDRFSDRELGAILTAARTEHHFPLLLLLARTGLRIGEACGLRWRDMQLMTTPARLSVVWQPDKWGSAEARRWLPRSMFGTNRSGPLGRDAELVKDNIHVASRFVGDRASLPEASEVERLEPGRGVVIERGGETLAVSMDRSGEIHAVDAVCIHMGCLVNWNDAETSWDCPCHGSRFTPTGDIVTGPATRALGVREAPGQP